MPEFAVTAIGRDRPGIVAAITGALLELDGNVADSQMFNLGGHFAVMLLVQVPDGVEIGPSNDGSNPWAQSWGSTLSRSPLWEKAHPLPAPRTC